MQLDRITTGELNGNGVFDTLIRTVEAHLQKEYNTDRITGSEYSNVYLGSLQAVLSTASQLALSMDKVSLENQLIQAQIDQTRQATANLVKQDELLDKQIEKTCEEIKRMAKDTELAQQQINQSLLEQKQVELNNDLLERRVKLADREIKMADLGLRKGETEIDINKQQLQLSAVGISKGEIENRLLNAELSRQAKIDTKLDLDNSVISKQLDVITVDLANKGKEGLILDANLLQISAGTDKINKDILRTDDEIALLKQRLETEKAQVNDVTTGVLGKQTALYETQRKGFLWDAEVKRLRGVNDVYSVIRSTNSQDAEGVIGINTTLENMITSLNNITIE